MRVVVSCRDEAKGVAAVAQLLAATNDRPDPADIDAIFEKLDVSSLASVRTCSIPTSYFYNIYAGARFCEEILGDGHASACSYVQRWYDDGPSESFG